MYFFSCSMNTRIETSHNVQAVCMIWRDKKKSKNLNKVSACVSLADADRPVRQEGSLTADQSDQISDVERGSKGRMIPQRLSSDSL